MKIPRKASVGGRKGFALDPRLLIGLLLVAGSVAGVWGVITASDDSVQVYAAADSLSPGDRIDAGDLTPTSVRVDDAGSLYLSAGDIPPEGVVVTRAVSRGELVPSSAVGSMAGVKSTAVVLTVEGRLAESVQAGSVVDVWASQQQENRGFAPPAVIVAGATVVRLVEEDSIVGSGSTVAVEVLVPRSKIARVLEAVANDDAVSIVPADLPVGR